MSFNGNLETLTGQLWDTRGCDTEYINDEDLVTKTLICRCPSVQNFYMGIITDRSRIKEVNKLVVENMNWIIWAVIGPLIFMGLVCPCIFLRLDRDDYDNLQMDRYDISEDICQAVMEKRKYSCIQEVYYRLKELDNYKDEASE